MPYLDIVISFQIFYPSTGSEVLRIARTTKDLIDVVKSINLLLLRAKKKR